MSTKYNSNFTNFQNIHLKGTGTADGIEGNNQGILSIGAGSSHVASTLSIRQISGSTDGSEVGSVAPAYFHLSGAGLSLGTGGIRMTTAGSSPYSTITLDSTYMDQDTAYQFPAKSGKFGISGTFTVDVPGIAAYAIEESLVTVAGIRAEDGLVATMQSMSTTGIGTRGFSFLGAANPENNGIYMTFINPTLTATLYTQHIIAYTAVR